MALPTFRSLTGEFKERVQDIVRNSEANLDLSVFGPIRGVMSQIPKPTKEEAIKQGLLPIGGSYIDLMGISSLRAVGKQATPKVFKGFKNLTTKVLDRLKGKSVTSKQEILDFTNMPELKQAERDLIRRTLADEGDKIDVPAFANRVKTELVPLKRTGALQKYEGVSLPDELRGPVADYNEHIYQSPIKTSAGDVHFSYGSAKDVAPNYFAHTRIEDLPK